jgi:lipocalin
MTLFITSSCTLVVCLLTSYQVLVKAQQTGVRCSAVTPINVPKDPSLYWGTWYTIGTCDACTSPENVCSQVAYEPVDATSSKTNVTYIGSFQDESPEGANNQAFGNMLPVDTDTFDPLYRLDLDLGFAVIPSNFWILTTAGDGNEISAIVTMSCNLTGGDQQLFFLSRKPYFVPPVNFDTLVAETKRAITNYDEFNITTVYQGQGWCDYELSETFASSSYNCNEDYTEDDRGRLRMTVGFSLLAMTFSFLTFSIIVYTKTRGTRKEDDLSKNIL